VTLEKGIKESEDCAMVRSAASVNVPTGPKYAYVVTA
jgi:hypothetical protein